MSFTTNTNNQLSEAADVSISNPVADQALVYNGTTQKWVNKAADATLVKSTTVRTITKLTQAEYDALTTPDTNTMYVIVG